MKDRAAAERACKDPNPIIDGRKANVNLAYLGAKPRTNVQLAGMQPLLLFSHSTTMIFKILSGSKSTVDVVLCVIMYRTFHQVVLEPILKNVRSLKSTAQPSRSEDKYYSHY